MQHGLLARFKNHPLIQLLLNLKGNPKVLTFIEPLWGIPHSLIAPFTTVYMRALGVSTLQIGIALSITMLFQVVLSFAGGIIADKLGRKLSTIMGDLLGWVLPCLIWAFAQNYWFFLAAMILNSFEQVNQTSWSCLLIEDAQPKAVLGIYNWVTISGLLAVFFSPISGALISHFSLVPVVRALYATFAICMVFKCAITARYATETKQGKIRMQESKNQHPISMAVQHIKQIPQIFKRKSIVRVLLIMVVLFTTTMISNNFVSLYATSTLQIPDSYLAYFPILRALVMLFFFFAIENKHRKLRMKAPMTFGLIIYIASQILLVFSMPGTIWPLIIYTLLEAIAFALVVPRRDALMVIAIEPENRARIVALLFAVMVGFSSPFGSVAAWLYRMDSRLPFVFSACLFLFAIWIVSRFKEKEIAPSTGKDTAEKASANMSDGET